MKFNLWIFLLSSYIWSLLQYFTFYCLWEQNICWVAFWSRGRMVKVLGLELAGPEFNANLRHSNNNNWFDFEFYILECEWSAAGYPKPSESKDLPNHHSRYKKDWMYHDRSKSSIIKKKEVSEEKTLSCFNYMQQQVKNPRNLFLIN